MAEKKKVEREFVEVSTGKTGSRPAVVTAANKKSATGKRIAALRGQNACICTAQKQKSNLNLTAKK